MRRALIIFLAVLAICALFTPIISAHSPAFPGNNTSLDSAYVVNDPTKSWALYTTLQPTGSVLSLRNCSGGEHLRAAL